MDNESIKKTIETMLERLTINHDVIEVIDDVHPIFMIRTGDSGVLIGNNGETLRAFNHVVKKIVHSADENGATCQFMVDVNGYYRRRIQEVKNQAALLAERARMFKSRVEMSPMNAYERMLVHALFSGDREINTESEGAGKFRRVVFKYVPNHSPVVKEYDL